jgi:hypothetical protein
MRYPREENKYRSCPTCNGASSTAEPGSIGKWCVYERRNVPLILPNNPLRDEMKNVLSCLTFAGRWKSTSTWARESHTLYSKVTTVTSYVSSTPRSVQYRNLPVQGRPSTKMPTVEVSSRVAFVTASTKPTGAKPRSPKDCLQRPRSRHQDRSNRENSQVVQTKRRQSLLCRCQRLSSQETHGRASLGEAVRSN